MSDSRSAVNALCGATEARCVCGEPQDHDGPHECSDHDACNGAWNFDGDNFVVVRYPKGGGPADMLAAMWDPEG